MSEEALLSAAQSPGGKPKKASGMSFGVKRLSGVPMYLVLAVVVGFVATMAMVAYNRSDKQRHPSQAEEKAQAPRDASLFAQELAAGYDAGMVPEEKPVQPTPLEVPADSTPVAVPIAVPPSQDEPPLPPSRHEEELAGGGDEDVRRIRQRKTEQLEQALAAKTAVDMGDFQQTRKRMQHGAGSAESEDEELVSVDPEQAYKAKLAQLQAAVSGEGGGGGLAINEDGGGSAPTSARNDLRQWAGNGQADRWRLDSGVEAPRSPYVLQAGAVIPAILLSGINSDLPGQIIAQVSQDVYDSPTGKHLLFPQGTRLVGLYNSDVIYAQERVMSAWQRLTFPDGKTLDIGAMAGATGAGYSGFTDQVDHHFWRVFGSAILVSFITSGVEISQGTSEDSANTKQRSGDVLSEQLGQQLGSVMAQMISKNLNVAPTLAIRPGYRFNVMVNKDMVFPASYHAFDYRG